MATLALKNKLVSFVILVLLLSLSTAIIIHQASCHDLPTRDPTADEQAIFQTLQRWYLGNKTLAPTQIGDAEQSKNLTTPVIITFECEKCVVTISITTKLVTWNASLRHPVTGDPLVDPNWAGAYIWNLQIKTPCPDKHIEGKNVIMFNPSVVKPMVNGTYGKLGQLDATRLYYHEMLHAQLFINQMKTNITWQSRVCQCQIDPLHDPNHQQIDALEDQFIKNIATALGVNLFVEKKNVPAARDGSFTAEVQLPQKQDYSYVVYPVNNIKSLTDTSNDKITVSGELEDPTKGGAIKVYIDPPTNATIADIFIYAPSPVGGIWVSIDKLALLAPYIALASTILVATAATAIYVKRVKRREKKQ